MFNKVITINEHLIMNNSCTRFGKIVSSKIKCDDKKKESSILIGLLNSVKDLIYIIENQIFKKLKKFKIENKVIEKDETRSLFSLGIKNDFNCFADF